MKAIKNNTNKMKIGNTKVQYNEKESRIKILKDNKSIIRIK